MRIETGTKVIGIAFALLLQALPASAATLGVAASATPAGSLYNYTYTFSVSGSGSVDSVFLGSDDLSPLSVQFTLNGNATSIWSWLGNDTPQNYLLFYSTAGSGLVAGDRLGAAFASAFIPASTHFAIGLNSVSGAATNQVTATLGPTATPEPATLFLILPGILALAARMAKSCMAKYS